MQTNSIDPMKGPQDMSSHTSGICSRCSISALNFQVIATIPNITADMIAVLAFQFAGCEYQPPAGDHTCFG